MKNEMTATHMHRPASSDHHCVVGADNTPTRAPGAAESRHPRLTRALLPLSMLALSILMLAWPLAAPLASDSRPNLNVPAIPEVPAGAFGADGIDDGEPRVAARLLAAPDPTTDGSAWVGVLFDLDPGWHLYWRNPGDTGLPTRLDWKIDSAVVHDIIWPVPHVFSEADGLFTTYGYEGRVLLQSPVRIDSAQTGDRMASVDIDLLICRQECIPAEISLRRSLDEALATAKANESIQALFRNARNSAPTPPSKLGVELEALYSQSAIRPGDSLSLGLVAHACMNDGDCTPLHIAEQPGFIPDAELGFTFAPAGVWQMSGHSSVETLSIEASEWGPDQDHGRLRGVLSLVTDSGGERFVEVDLPVPWAASDASVVDLGVHWLEPGASTPDGAAPAASNTVSLLLAIVLAFAGGLILNLMPCVLPVLAIKVFSVAELAERDRRDVIMNGVAYTSGILASMAVLGGVVVGLRSAGTAVGWGFQFQSPTFIAAVAMVLVAFAMNLFGVWEIRWTGGSLAEIGQEATGTRRSFFEGLLAVVLSTPCSAPFLGTAVGFAFAGSAWSIFAIFGAIGLGLASPFLLVTLIPGASRVIPKSGTWMMKLRAGLGFALLATVVWLSWIVGQSAGVEGMTLLTTVLLGLAFALWFFGATQQMGRQSLARASAALVVIVSIAGLNTIGAELQSTGDSSRAEGRPDGSEGSSAWREFAPEAIEASLRGGHPVLVAFSADWCITCKVNEMVVLDQESVQAELERLEFETFKADWTRRDEGIRSELARHGRAGVPMYLVYSPHQPGEPEVLPEILSEQGVLDALRRAAIRENAAPSI